jgi:parallel beta-helix repeat protein
MQNLKNRSKRFYIASSLVLIAMLLAGSMIFLALRYLSGGNSSSPVKESMGNGSQHYITPRPSGNALYVSPTGNDSHNGSEAQPFATIQKAADVVKPGATVYVLPGTYNEDVVVKNDGTANARIAFVSLKQWAAKIKTTNDNVPWTTKADYIDIIGFDISSDGARDGLLNWGSFTRTIGNRIHDIPSTCDDHGGSGMTDTNYNSHDNDIIGNVVFNIGDTYPKMCPFVHAIYHSNARGHIVNNIAYNNAGCGINLWHAATDTIVSNNLVFGNKEHGISIGTDPKDNDGDDGDHFIVTNNISINNGILGMRERKGVGSHNQFSHNIVYGNGRVAFGDESYEWPSTVDTKDVDTITREVMFASFKDDGAGDYHLQANSSAIDAGIALGAPSTDFDGNPRPEGKGYDIGPFEYQ